MIIMSKEKVKRYLDNLLVELEVRGDEKTQKKFVATLNYYAKEYNLQEYVEKESRICYTENRKNAMD